MATELFKLMGRITIEMDDAESSLKRFETLLNNAVTALQSIDTKLTSVNSTLNTMDTRLSDANAELGELGSKAGSANTAINKLDGNVDSLNGSMSTLDSRANSVANELGQIDSKSTSAGAKLAGFNSKLKTLHNPFSEDGALGAGAVWLGNILEDLMYKALDLSWEFLKIGINFNASAETYQASFKTMLGVTEKEATEIYEKLRQFAVDTPYSMEGVTDSAVRLFNAGYDVESTLDMLEVLGNIANGDSAKMERLVKAWTDTKGYGFLRAQERNQFVENGVMINQLLADYYASQDRAISADEITGMLTKKQVTDMDVLNALLMAQEEGGNYYKAMENIMDTWGGHLEKTGDQLDQTAGAFMLPFFDELKDEVMPQLSALLGELETWSKDNSELLSQVATDLGGAATGTLSGLLDLFTYLVERKDTLLPILQAIGGAFAISYATEHPLVAILGALTAMAADDPEAFDELLTSLSELATAILDFANGALKALSDFWTDNNMTETATAWFTSLIDGFTTFLDFIAKEEGRIEGVLVLLGALAMATGHPVAGIAILGSVYPHVLEDFQKTVVNPVTEDPAAAVDTADNNLKSGTTIFHYMTGTGAYSEKEAGYTRNTTPWERLLLGFAEFTGGDERRAEIERGMGLVTDPLENLNLLGARGNNATALNLLSAVQELVGEAKEAVAGIPAAVADGVGNITVNGYVTTGRVVLDSGTVVGELTPKINMALGNFYAVSYRDD